jgi:hypothetical protein
VPNPGQNNYQLTSYGHAGLRAEVLVPEKLKLKSDLGWLMDARFVPHPFFMDFPGQF